MKKIALLLFFLFCASTAIAQNSITVSISVTDLGGQVWLNGTYTANFVGPTNVSWPGGTVARSVSGSLSVGGTATQSLANNNTITPSPTFWTFTVCPAAGVSSGCFTTASISVTTPSQAVTITPPAISIPASSTNSPVGAYADAEITSNAFVGALYTQITALQGPQQRMCQTVSGGTCTSWAGTANATSIVGPLTFAATNYGVKADVVYVPDATWTNGQNTVTCPNNDCNFTAADNTKLCWGINAAAGTNTLPVGSLVVTGPQSATCSVATGSIVAAGNFAWCTDDTNSWITLRNAYYASQRAAYILGPGGGTCVTKAPLRDTRANTTNAAMWQPSFQSPSGMTVFFPTPTFDFTTCLNPINGMLGGCFWDTAPTGATNQNNLPQYSKVQNLGVNGLNFNALPGASNTASAAAFNRVEGSNIWLWNWGAGAAGFTCATVTDPNSFFNMNINSCGNVGMTINGGFSNGITWLTSSYIGGGGMGFLLTANDSGIVVSKGSYYLTGCTNQCIVVGAGGSMSMDGDEVQGASGNQYIDVFGTLYMINGVQMVATNNSGHAILTRATGKAYIKGSKISETGTGGIAFNVNLVPGGSIINEGDNTIVGTDQTALAASMIVMSAGWGTTATTSAFSGTPSSNPTRFSFQANSAGTGQAANPTLAFTYPNVGSTPTWTCKQVGGTGTLTTISGEGTATSTTMTLTFNGTPVAGSNYIITCTGALQ